MRPTVRTALLGLFSSTTQGAATLCPGLPYLAPSGLFIATGVLCAMLFTSGAYAESEEERIAKRIEAWQDMKFGFFVHWGTYSQWGCTESWPLVEEDEWARPDDLDVWVERGKDIERFKRDYWDLNKTFNPTAFDPHAWAAPAKYAGMRYFVFTTKHHDGFCMFDTQLTDYRITGPDCPYRDNPRANVTLELFDTFRQEGFAIGAYFSKSDWHSPYYWSPDEPARTRNPNYDTHEEPKKWSKFVEFVHNQVEELMTEYGRVDILWLDGGQVQPPDQDIQMDIMVAMARKHHPNLIVVDRTVGGKYENYRTPEQEVPEEPLDYPWETCMTMGTSFSYKPDDEYKSTRQLIHILVDIVAKGGNLLLNVGPKSDGTLPEPALKRMKEIGDWMRINNEAIFSTRPYPPYKENNVCYTRRGDTLYAIYMPPEGQDSLPPMLSLPSIVAPEDAEILLLKKGAGIPVSWTSSDGGIVIEIPEAAIESPPCEHAFVFRIPLELEVALEQ